MNASTSREDELFPWERDDAALPPNVGETRASGDAAAALERSAEKATTRIGADVAIGTPPPNRPIAPKEYYSISEVCDLVGLKPHVLRYWESQFTALNPSKNLSGNRVYQRKEIRLILLVKHLLYDEKYTVEGARAKLERLRRGAQLGEAAGRTLEPQLIRLLRQDLDELKAILTPPTR
ncbi:MAG: MerR family transcriptional regulator [Longimicrobiales bacterium]